MEQGWKERYQDFLATGKSKEFKERNAQNVTGDADIFKNLHSRQSIIFRTLANTFNLNVFPL